LTVTRLSWPEAAEAQARPVHKRDRKRYFNGFGARPKREARLAGSEREIMV
jgi:hypothetical protein